MGIRDNHAVLSTISETKHEKQNDGLSFHFGNAGA